MITVRGLARQFTVRGRTVDAVKGIDFDVAAGELVGFLGPNGAGKTTTLRMLTTLLRPTGGTATVGGCDLLTDPQGVRRRIGYVAQGGSTWPDSRVAEEIELQARLYGLSRADARRRGTLLAEQLDLAGLDQRPAKTLSGGQRRRLDIALGLVHDPALVFLDEPTSGLDPQSRANLWEHVRRMRAEQGMTVFLTTHYLDEADSLCDRILVTDHGTIVAEGTPDELKARVTGDAVAVDVADRAAEAAELAEQLPGAEEVTVAQDTVRFRVPRGDSALPELLRALDGRGILMTSVQINRPTLDDVFLSLTGRSLRDSEAAPPAMEATHAA
ncbi:MULTISPECIES: daunorubicin resistance protein DrrA family ABC transporter ATP-binding protein [Streptomyces]|uniref:daunorubicin resistance protein DrrA family ABC transporter ATP-binding protein n=1 Tax=Streptomyces TaxID=1883 RepID=UPI000517094C|nr:MULTISPECIES: daunorubicin resistance protein DrrA family ABC transporter ATP-binding protein [Streptomyces]WDT90706.1 daunorubicin resistance protein DrrA family ABC transporter ATP-binding protein [Streptomyces sp. SCSIO-PteL053]KAA6202172.1 daunorubicin resistance protein DrrA family ABC transporter ATP-binding protein [Streptomyces parvus]PVC90047.1 daunorubicin resistance protein DrrA family ABC transporter ATP-binding protein [Streptomyces sp. CS131]SCF58529.1 ABC-2 type transport syst